MPSRQALYVQRRWEKLLTEYGGQCAACGKRYDLEFAHIAPTDVKGKGRGKARRLFDILRYPTRYTLLCASCHDILDGMNRRRQADYLTADTED